MASEGPAIALRLALYVDLAVLFGVPLFALQVLGPGGRGAWLTRRYAGLAAGAVGLGLVLSAAGLALMARDMAGASDLSGVTRHVLEMILTRTAAGFAWGVRMVALLACLPVLLVLRRQARAGFGLLALLGAAALASLAWSGHGAMDEGARGALHLGADVLHLLAAGAWVGALVGFVSMSPGTAAGHDESVATLERSAKGFARTGTVLVSTLVVTGVINYVLVAGASLDALFTTLYGRLLAIKLGVVALMLGLAAGNRYVFAPRLARATGAAPRSLAVGALRRSLATEATLGLVVLALVAWLGTLAPEG